MGEIADMMLDGTLCQYCGLGAIGDQNSPGYPRYCQECTRELKTKEKRAQRRADFDAEMRHDAYGDA